MHKTLGATRLQLKSSPVSWVRDHQEDVIAMSAHKPSLLMIAVMKWNNGIYEPNQL